MSKRKFYDENLRAGLFIWVFIARCWERMVKEKVIANPTSRWWCVTIWDCAPVWDSKTMKYMVYQVEKTGEGKLHWQTFVELKAPCRMAGAIAALGKTSETCHIEKMRGNRDEARAYCMKEESRIEPPSEYGLLTKRGERSDLKTVCDKVLEGIPIKEIAAEFPDTYVRNYRGLASLKAAVTPARNWPTELHIIWGESGAGKTRMVHETESELFNKMEGLWWDGYDGEEAVLIDDVVWNDHNIGGILMMEFLKICDRYPLKVQVKGGSVNFVSRRVYVTSMYDPEKFLLLAGIKRRVTSVTKLPR